MSTALFQPYCTLLEVQQETKNSGSENDDVYRTAINLASRFIEDYCRRDFWFHDHTVDPLQVPRAKVMGDMVCLDWPILTLTDLRVWDRSAGASTPANSLPVEGYYFDPGHCLITREHGTFGGGAGFMEGAYNPNLGSFGTNSGRLTADTHQGAHGYPFRLSMELYGTFGYALDTDPTNYLELPPPKVPAAVRRACVILAANWSNENHKQVVGLDGSKTELLETRVGSEVKMLLERWVNMVQVNF